MSMERVFRRGANGITKYDTKVVRVRDDVDQAQAVKTLAHELGHVLLHDTGESRVCRGIVEVEAESVAYLVAAGHGLDTSDYTFPYVTDWAHTTKEDSVKVVRATGQRVVAAAHQILEQTTAASGESLSELSQQPTSAPDRANAPQHLPAEPTEPPIDQQHSAASVRGAVARAPFPRLTKGQASPIPQPPRPHERPGAPVRGR